ncbi:MAG: hypothetical protein JXQ73_14730 [Phycisphaerae bacterium]|nr:hypothetical protein [Phycisphaerae bacterium]
MSRQAFDRSTGLLVSELVITLLAPGPVRSAEPWSCTLGPDYPPCIGVDPNYDCGVADICLSANGNQPGGNVIVEAGGTITVKVCLYSDYWCVSPMRLSCPGALPEVILNGEPITGFTENDMTVWDGSRWRGWPIMDVWIPPYSEHQESTVVFTLDPCFRAERHMNREGDWVQPSVGLSHTSLWWEYVGFEVLSPPYVLRAEVRKRSTWIPGEDGRDVNVYLPFGSLNVPERKSFPAGTVVQLEATPDAGHCVGYWKGTDNDDSKALTNTVTMDGHRDVIIEFWGGNNCRNAPSSSSSPGCGTAAALLGSAMLFGLVWARRGDKRRLPPRQT